MANDARSPIEEHPVGPDQAPPTARRRGIRLPEAFESLRHPNYRLLWIGMLISNSGGWITGLPAAVFTPTLSTP